MNLPVPSQAGPSFRVLCAFHIIVKASYLYAVRDKSLSTFKALLSINESLKTPRRIEETNTKVIDIGVLEGFEQQW